ncbi:DNA-binding NarL/FixJ family response regulator [Natronospira proteinivora]|uniref:DNA-binding NarL/FixJ family response regulator n=1 Tax=Natronospira proteinivora TaxID=1807133 RepID=A0ABT1G511_9GAMM|nr:response regulator transcription factor [Natronospira proteinivora]MCP1726384.1 DNA-binding NarL/FixJ family response regulator [Natronospira proteinivora]
MTKTLLKEDSRAKVKLLLVDDHSVVRMGIRQALADEFSCLECANAAEARIKLREHNPGISVVDLSLPDEDGLSLIQALHQQAGPPLGIVVFSRHRDAGIIYRALELGASAYINKRSSIRELRKGLHAVSHHEHYLCPTSRQALDEVGSLPTPIRIDQLTQREMALIRAISEGLCANGLAKRFNISTNTVGNHRRNIMKKLGVTRLSELYRLAMELELPHN